jgi:hypothetical protein
MGQHGQSTLNPLNRTVQHDLLPKRLAHRPHTAEAAHLSAAQAHLEVVAALHGPRHQRGRIEETASLGFNARAAVP